MVKNTNDVILYKYQEFSIEADGVTEKTLESRLYSLDLFVQYNPELKKISPAKAKGFKKFLKQIKVNGHELSLKRQRRILGNVQGFLSWLCLQPGYKTAIPKYLISYYSLSNKENRLANISQRRDFPSLKHVIELIRRLV